jgi:DNA-binding NarL/FixJ family response regulator
MDSKAVPSESIEIDSTSQANAQLSQRELQVLRSVFEGLTNKEIAHTIGVSQSSVKATLQRLFEKTGVRTRAPLLGENTTAVLRGLGYGSEQIEALKQAGVTISAESVAPAARKER